MPSTSVEPEIKLFDPSGVWVETSNIITAFSPITILRGKVVVVGDESCGKTSLITSFLTSGQNYPKKYNMTTSVDLTVGEVVLAGSNITVDLFIFDTAGQSIFNQRGMQSAYYDGASFIVCVYDVSSRRSFQNCSKWIQSVRSAQKDNSAKEIQVLLVANKIDLRDDEVIVEDSRVEVDEVEGRGYANENGFEYFECSVLNGVSVDLPFQSMASKIWQNYKGTKK